MSLCISLYYEGNIYVWADSRVSTEVGGKSYVVTDDYDKIRQIGNRVVFASGDVEIAERVFAGITADCSYEGIQRISQVAYNEFVAARKDDTAYANLKHGIEFGVYVHEIVNGVPVYVQFGHHNDFEVNYQEPGDQELFAVAARSDIALPYAARQISLGRPLEFAIIRTFEHVADEVVGGILSTFLITPSEIAHRKDKIHDRKSYPKWRGRAFPFMADMRGNVIARSITLTGLVENSKMTSSDIVGGTITGALIRTSTSGARVEMDAKGWRTYDSSGRERISINANDQFGMNAISFAKSDGSGAGTINGGDTVFQMYSFGDMLLAALNGGRLFLGSGGGFVDFSGATVLGLTIDSVSNLRSTISAIQSSTANSATKGTSTGSAGPYNCGIPIGTKLATDSGGYYTWEGVPAHTHTQQ